MNNIELISKHRSELMLLSILWVMAFHFTPPNSTFINPFFRMGYGGVDFFMFLSGFGLSYSYFNRENFTWKVFVMRRLSRILPTYFVCILVFGLIKHISINVMLWHFSCVGFWVGKPYYDWYVPSILLLYLVFPLFRKYGRQFGIGKIVILASVIGLLPTAMFVYLWKGTPILFTSRIPIFFIGCYVGNMLANKKDFRYPKMLMAVSVIATVIMWYMICTCDSLFLGKTALNYLPFIFIVPGTCLLLSKIMNFVPDIYLLPLKFLGAMTLEIYLCHMSGICNASKYLLPIIVAILLHYVIKFIKILFVKLIPLRF